MSRAGPGPAIGAATATYQTISGCRVCGNQELLPILDLGHQALTGVFPRSRDEANLVAPLEMVKCSPAGCGLVQLRHTADLTAMFGEQYGYQSSIRPFMVHHLAGKVDAAIALVDPGPDDLVLDIGSNDGTLLRAFPQGGPHLVGCDPSAEKYRDQYPAGSDVIVDFFSADAFTRQVGDRKAKIVTSMAMFYNLPDPIAIMRDVCAILADDGIWMIEHSYLPAMLDNICYDNVCHEHLSCYALAQLEYMAARSGLKVLSAEVTDVYNGSLCSVLVKESSTRPVDEAGLGRLRTRETEAKLDTMAPFDVFGQRVARHRDELRDFLDTSHAAGLLTLGYGASTKGNVILQYCGVSEQQLPCIGEFNTEKIGRFTPGTGIPIVSEEAAKAQRPDQLLVLPWIYRDGFIEREQQFMADGGRLVIPLPKLEIVRK